MKLRTLSSPLLPSCILFDVDGTLVDSAPVVIDIFIEVLTQRGIAAPSPHALRAHVGPPLWQSLRDLGIPPEDLEEVIGIYRSLYRQRFLEPPLFDGIDSLLHSLHTTGIPLATATSKQEYMAREQLEYLELAELFTVIAGATPDPDSTKTSVLRDALRRLSAAGADISRPILVGDRHFDVEGARHVGIAVLGAGWGYASEGELDEADAFARDTVEARTLLIGQ